MFIVQSGDWLLNGFLLHASYIQLLKLFEWAYSVYSRTSLSDHLTKIQNGSSVSQIAISEITYKRPPIKAWHQGRLLTGGSTVYMYVSAFALGLAEIRQKTQRCCKNTYDGLENAY